MCITIIYTSNMLWFEGNHEGLLYASFPQQSLESSRIKVGRDKNSQYMCSIAILALVYTLQVDVDTEQSDHIRVFELAHDGSLLQELNAFLLCGAIFQ